MICSSLTISSFSLSLAYVQGILYCNGNITKYREASDAVFYNQQHSWMLFSSLALSMAHKLSDDKKKKGENNSTS